MKEGLVYNSARERLIIPAYGRHTQEMLEHAATLPIERQQPLVERIVRMMAQMYAGQSNQNREDLERKLWRHAYRMADYQLEAVPPDGEIPLREHDAMRPEEVPYPKSVQRNRHYGQYVSRMIDEALQIEDDPQRRQAFANTIANYMKLAYQTWNKDHHVTDQTIRQELSQITDGQLTVEEDVSLDAFTGRSTSHPVQPQTPSGGRKSHKKRSGRKRFRRRR